MSRVENMKATIECHMKDGIEAKAVVVAELVVGIVVVAEDL